MNILAEIYTLIIGFATMNSRMNNQEKKTKEMERNYIQRFEDLNNHVTKNKEEIVDRIGKMHIDIIDRINGKKK